MIEKQVDLIDFEEDSLKQTERGVLERKEQIKAITNLPDEEAEYFARNEEALDTKLSLERWNTEVQAKDDFVNNISRQENPDLDLISAMISYEPQRIKRNVLDKEYGRTFAEEVAASAFTLNEYDVGDEEVERSIDVMEEMATKASIARKVADRANKVWEDKSGFGKTGSVLYSMIPFIEWFSKNDAASGEMSSILQGNNIEEQIQYLWRLPPDEMEDAFSAAVDTVRKYGGDLIAMDFANAVVTYSGTDKHLENLFGLMDLPVVGGINKLRKLATITKDASKSAIKNGPDAVETAADLGHTVAAATHKAQKSGAITNGVTTVKDYEDFLPSLFNVDRILRGAKNISGKAFREITESAEKRASRVRELRNSTAGRIDALTDLERVRLAAKTVESISKTAADITIRRAEDTKNNVDEVVVTFGKSDGSFFDTEKAADTWIKRYLQFKDAKVSQVGDKFAVEVTRPIKQGEDLRNLSLSSDMKADRGWKNSWLLRKLQSQSVSFSEQAVKDRRVTSDFAETATKTLDRLAAPIQNLKGRQFDEFEKALDNIASQPRPASKDRRWLDLGEFRDRFEQVNKKQPTIAQQDAYISYQQIYDTDYMLRDLTAMTQKHRAGIENWEVRGVEGAFEGIQKDSIPFNTPDYFRVVAIDEAGKVLKKGSNSSDADTQKFFQDLLDKNYTVVQSASTPLKVGDTNAMFVVTNTGKRSVVLPGQSVMYNPGGHKILKHPFMIKQPNFIETSTGKMYTKDTTLFNVLSKGQGEKILAVLEEARKVWKTGDKKAFNRFVTDNLPELHPSDLKRIDFDTPFAVTKTGERIVDTEYLSAGREFTRNLQKNVYDVSSRINSRFMQERDAQNISALVSEGSAIRRINQAEKVNPVEAMNIGIQDAFRGTVHTEYLEKSANSFTREFRDILDVSDAELNRNPIPFLVEPRFKSGVDPEKVSRAKDVSEAVKHMIGVQTESSKHLQSFKEHIADYALEKLGKDSRLYKIVDERLLHTVKDPTTFFRSLAFHSKMGLFNPKHLFLQSQMVVNAMAIGGIPEALRGMAAYSFGYGLKLTNKPEMLEEAARRVSKFGWDPEEFKESQRLLNESGFDIIGGTSAIRDWYEGPRLVKSSFGKMLDHGTSFFKKGEQIGRVVSWHTAYQNFRKANPGKKITRADVENIRMKASDMTANMTRDMNASWQTGKFSMATQFWGFQARIFEQMWSPTSRLTVSERARLLGGMSLMYGVPVSGGAAVGWWPVAESVRQWLIEEGYDETVDDSFLLKAITEGVVSASVNTITGVDFDNTVYGPAGNPYMKEILSSEKDLYEVFGGASASIIADTMSPLVSGLYDMITYEDTASGLFDVANDAVVTALRNTSSGNAVHKILQATETGKYITKNGSYVGDMTTAEAYVSALLGMNLQEHTDAFLRADSMKEMNEAARAAVRDASNEYRKAREALDRGDTEAMERHIKKAKTIGILNGLTIREMSRARSRGFSEESFTEAMEENFNKYYTRKRRINEGR